MSKFVYHNNGKITRLDMTGIPIMSTKGVSSLSASTDGNYIIMKTGDTYSFAPTTAGLTAVTPQNLTNITANNKNYLLAIGSDNNFKQILFSNNTINNTFSYVNDQWVLEKKGLFEQYAETADDAVNIFALPIINNNKETKIITPTNIQTGKYLYNVKNTDELPTLEKMSIDKEDINYTNSWGSNAHIIYVDRSGKLSSIQLKDSFYSGIRYNESQKRYEFVKLTFYDQAGTTKPTVKGFALPIINSSKGNDQITLPSAEQGEYIIDYSGSGNPTLKKVSYISEVTPNTLFNSNPPDKDSFMIVSKDGFKTLTPDANAAFIPSFDGNNITLKRLYSPRFTRYSLDTGRDYELPASGTVSVQDIFQDLTGINVENSSMIHLKIFFYLADTAQQENTIGSFTITRKTSSTESEELCTHYIYSPVDNLITANFTFQYQGNISSMSLVTSLSTGVKIIGGMKCEMLIDTQLRF